MDPHGADQRGNPLGGLLFSPSFGSELVNGTTAPASSFTQVKQWHNFIGSGSFCLKACDPSYGRDYELCEHIYDRIGCSYNAPADYQKIQGSFESCEGDDQLPPGQYVQNGRTLTYTQPPESLGAISTIPYVAAIPKSSSCVPYESSAIYRQGAAVVTTSAEPTTATSVTSSEVSSATVTSETASATSAASGTSASSAVESATSEAASSSAASTQETASIPSATGTVGESSASAAPAATAANTSGAVGASVVSSVVLALVGGVLILTGIN